MWPSWDRYNAVINTPENCFPDPTLRLSRPRRDKRGLPAPVSGAFGCVYEMEAAAHRWAVKCFTREVLTSEWRYTEVSAYIKRHPSPHLVICDYLVPRGILVDDRWYPVLKMEWVAGLTLDRFLDRNLDHPLLLEDMAERWVGVMAALEERGMAHGDLQHGNIMVCEEAGGLVLKLVDYDGMYVPAFEGEEGEESGLRDYQHPRRTGHNFNARMDNFPALVIYLSLRALALQPDLWPRYHTDENLLFQRKDFLAPDQSPLFAELARLPDRRLVELVAQLRVACADPDPCRLDALPRLVAGHAAPVASATVVAEPPPPVIPAPAPPAPPVVPPAPVPPLVPPPPGGELLSVCPHCNERNRPIARYCRGCGLALPYTQITGNAPLPLVAVGAAAVRICPWCDLENPADARWCRGCTALLD